MKKTLNTLEIAAALTDQVSRLESQIKIINNKLGKLNQDLDVLERRSANPGLFDKPAGGKSNIIPFPGSYQPQSHNPMPKRSRALLPFLAAPGKALPPGMPDFRSVLQRDGLILLAWDKRKTEMGERYTAYWVTSAGIARFYASKPLALKEFSYARPDHKSYAAEDGIEFYGQDSPAYIVHVAPELMMNNPRHGELRLSHISELKLLGSKVDFNYKYLLKTEKNQESHSHRAGA